MVSLTWRTPTLHKTTSGRPCPQEDSSMVEMHPGFSIPFPITLSCGLRLDRSMPPNQTPNRVCCRRRSHLQPNVIKLSSNQKITKFEKSCSNLAMAGPPNPMQGPKLEKSPESNMRKFGRRNTFEVKRQGSSSSSLRSAAPWASGENVARVCSSWVIATV